MMDSRSIARHFQCFPFPCFPPPLLCSRLAIYKYHRILTCLSTTTSTSILPYSITISFLLAGDLSDI
jgi:hypothetical protein